MNKVFIFFALAVVFTSCRDIFERDISGESLSLTFPLDNYRTENTNVTLQWYEVDQATSYQVLIVSPKFDTTYTYYMDSTLSNTELSLTLDPGQYQWKVRAMNNAYQTSFSVAWAFEIDSSYNLSNQTLLLNSPTEGTFTNDSSFNFNWQSLYAADDYNFVLKEGTVWSSAVELANEILTTNSYSNTIGLSEGKYLWGVNASNSMPSETGFYEYRTLYIDQTVPAKSLIVSPTSATSGLFKDSTIAFDWYRYAHNGTVNSSVLDSVFIYSDTLSNPISTLKCETEDTTYVFSTAGVYYWKVKTYDEAGNENESSYASQFTVQ